MRCRLAAISSSCGQSLVETALLIPFLLMLVFNAVNFGYFFFVALNLAAAPRSGVEYSTLGFATPGQLALPSPGPASSPASVSFLTYEDMRGALASASSTPLQVCTKVLGLNNPGTSTQTAKCASYGAAGTFPAPDPDPESPVFVLHRVDVIYSFSPLIPGTPFGIALLPASICSSSGGSITCKFHRQVSMRAMD